MNVDVDYSSFFGWFAQKVVKVCWPVSWWFTQIETNERWVHKTTHKLLKLASASRLVQKICDSLRTKLVTSHATFLQSIQKMETQYLCQAEKNSVFWKRINKSLVPKLSYLHLKSTSTRDQAIRGKAQLCQELGRGQYGVVYFCDKWGEFTSCAVKTLSPPDERHVFDVCIEIYYARSLPLHERVVSVLGTTMSEDDTSIHIFYEKYDMDLSKALKKPMSLQMRMGIALEIVEGIRFIHSQGHIHRDIKLNNVMLDSNFHAKLTDFGFCKPVSMISGTIVGTPIHMSPELLSGKYGNRVDIFAFGILFWYLSSGCCTMPNVYQQCDSIPELWSLVSRGQRPERLSSFNDEMWRLMVDCWSSDPSFRPHIGEVEQRLRDIYHQITN